MCIWLQNEASKMRMEAWKIRDRTYAVRVKRRSADLLRLGLETAGAVLRRNAKKQNSIKKKDVDMGAPSHGRGDISLSRGFSSGNLA
jgi:hypothetical protein